MKPIYTDKHLDFITLALRPTTNLLVAEGPIRSSKTISAITAFFYKVYNDEYSIHLIAGRDSEAIMTNLVDAEMGLLSMFPNHCKMVYPRKGAPYLQISSPKGLKKCKLVGFGDASKWKKVLGGTIKHMLIDEVNIADATFIKECFARQTSFKDWLTIWTLNGDEPMHYIYQEYINRCNIFGKAPASTIAQMAKANKVSKWYYTFWAMWHNPVMDKELIKNASLLYPKGSHYYVTKFLGERGSPGVLLYADYLNADRHIKKLEVRDYQHFGIGFDIGATRAFNSISLWGFKHDYSKIGGIDKTTFKQCGYEEKTQHLIAFVRRYQHLNIKYVSVDSAELNYIKDLQTLFKRIFPNIAVIPSYKATIKERVDLGIILLSHDQLEFNDTQEGRDMYDAFMIAKKSEKPREVREDNNERHIDIIDSCEYAWTRHMNALLKAAKDYEKFRGVA